MGKFNTVRAYFSLSLYLAKLFVQLLVGIWKLSRLKHAPVTVFGGTHLQQDSIYLQNAHTLAHKLLEHDVPVLTGGGPGIMEAANCGAVSSVQNTAIVTTVGISVKGLSREQEFNKCAQLQIVMDNFFSRKWLLVNYSVGFAIFPGGFGTLDELTELLTLIQRKHRKRAPIVLVGVAYWQPFIDWIHNSALTMGLISPQDISLFTLTDDLDHAAKLLTKFAKEPFTL